MGLFLTNILTAIIRMIIFTVPVSFVAHWCGVEPTWQSAAFMCFCIFWSGCVFDVKEDWSGASARQGDPSAVNHRKAAADVMTPAQVAAAARKLTREWKLKADR